MNSHINRGDVFYANINSDGTHCQCGKRPVVIISNECCNRYSPVVSIVCLSTSKLKKPLPTHVPLLALETGLHRDSICLCEQPMSIAKSNLLDFVTHLGVKHMNQIDSGLRCQLCL